MTMRIGLVYLGRFGAGGPFSLCLAKELARLVQVEVFVSAYSDSIHEWQESSIHVHLFPTFHNGLELAASFFNRRSLARVVAGLRAANLDVLIFSMAHPWNALLQSMLAPVPSVVIVHDPTPHPGLVDRITHYFENQSVRRANAVIGLSQTLLPQLVARAEKDTLVATMPLGQLYQPASPDLFTFDTLANRVLFFGRITPYKGLEVLLAAFQKVQAEIPAASLQIVGSGNLRPYQPILRRLANLEVINRWIDHSEIDAFFRKASILVLPYTSASQSGVVATAAAYGIPVIATHTGGLPEQVVSGTTGILVAPGAVDALADAIIDLLRNPQKAVRMGQALKQNYSKDHSWETAAQELLKVCDLLVKT